MRKPSALYLIVQPSELEQAKSKDFLTAWKSGVCLAGAEYFDLTCDSVDQVTTKEQLRPDLRMIFESVGVLSRYEQVFILSLCQFYRDKDVRDYCHERGRALPSLADIANLDDEQREIIVVLLNSYAGW